MCSGPTFLSLLALILASSRAAARSDAQRGAAAIALDGGCSAGGGASAGECAPADGSLGLWQSKVGARRSGSGAASPPLPPVGFLKTHKTGGSTMSNILHRLVERQHLRLLFPNNNMKVDWPSLLQTVPAEHQFDMVCNHNIFNETTARAYLKPSPFFFTILREPVSATDSRFRFRRIGAETWPLRMEYMRQRRPSFCNPFARDLGWYGLDSRDLPNDAPLREVNASAVAAFVESLDRALDLVILTEYYDEGVVLLRRKLGLTLEEVAYVRMKVALGDPAVLPPPTREERSVLLGELLPVDQALYEHFHRRFWREWEAAGGEAVLGGELAELKERNAQLERACAGNSEDCPQELVMDNRVYTMRLMLAAGLPAA